MVSLLPRNSQDFTTKLFLMFKRIPLVSLVAVLVVSLLSACSVTDHKNLSGQAAKNALEQVMAASEAKYVKEGGTETVYVGKKRYVLLYNPDAPEGEQVAFQDLDSSELPQLGAVEMLRIPALVKLLQNDVPADGTYKLSDNVFTIKAGEFNIQITVKDDLFTQAIVTITTAASQDTTMFATTYGFSKDAKKLLSSATPSPAPAQ